jgi:UDP-3-O-[3-hydroxymyristoyl] glucosamine N-acyltransferase
VAETRLSELCNLLSRYGLDAKLVGEDVMVRAVHTLEEAGDGDLSFLSNPKYLSALAKTRAIAVLVGPDVELPAGASAIRTNDPYAAVTIAIIAIHGHRRHPRWGAGDRATIHSTARLGDNANIGPGVTIEADAVIGNNCTLYPGCFIAGGVSIGDDCTLYPNVVIYDGCTVGDRVTIHAGSVVGQDGLGYAPHEGRWIKIPQIGTAVIGNDVEIGANCAIDRATLGRTEIGAGTKFGNEVVIGHGTKVGPDCMFVGQVGVAGSVTIGRHVTLAGQVGVAGHLTIGDDARVGGQSGISGDVPPRADILGSPAIPIETAKRSLYVFQKLPDWTKRIKELEREIERLRATVGANGKSSSR